MSKKVKESQYSTKTPTADLLYMGNQHADLPEFNIRDIKPMVSLDNLPSQFQKRAISNATQWQNLVANIGTNNSLIQHSEYILNRLSYQECANIATDTLINKAITTIVNEIFKQGGIWNYGDISNQEWTKTFEKTLKQLDVFNKVKEVLRNALIYGGAFLFINTTDADTSLPLYLSSKGVSKSRLKGFSVLSPWQVAPIEVNSANPLGDDYMVPTQWYVLGASASVHHSRLIPVTFFNVPDLIKPIFNYLGLPISFFMKEYVIDANLSRSAVAELLLRFRTNYIRTTANKIADRDFLERIKYMNKLQNNFGTVLLAQEEELQQINTPLSGLDSLLSQMYEFVTMTTGMPVTKFLGLSPRGFNATGEHDENNFYDLIAEYQQNIAKPVLDQVALCVSNLMLHNDKEIEYVFHPLERLTKNEKADLDNKRMDYLLKLEQIGIITPEDGLRAIQEEDYSFSWIESVPEREEFDMDDDDGDKVNDNIVNLFGDENNVPKEFIDKKKSKKAKLRKKRRHKQKRVPKGCTEGGQFAKEGIEVEGEKSTEEVVENKIYKNNGQYNSNIDIGSSIKQVKEIVNIALTDTSNNQFIVSFGEINENIINILKEKLGIDLTEFKFAIDNYSIRHIFKRHGNGVKEQKSGQIGISEKDFEYIPYVFNSPDEFQLLGETDIKRKAIEFRKQTETGKLTCVVEILTGKKLLSLKTLYKHK